jgi:hypothetical protein
MKKIRPFGWVIIVVNLYFVINFFSDYDVNGDPTANGIGVMVLVLWLAILNVVMYVLYRVTSRQKTSSPATLEGKLKEIEKLKSEGLITTDEYTLRRRNLIEGD